MGLSDPPDTQLLIESALSGKSCVSRYFAEGDACWPVSAMPGRRAVPLVVSETENDRFIPLSTTAATSPARTATGCSPIRRAVPTSASSTSRVLLSPRVPVTATDNGRATPPSDSATSPTRNRSSCSVSGPLTALHELGALCEELRAEVAEQSLGKVQRLATVALSLASELGGERGQALASRLGAVCDELARDFGSVRLDAANSSRSSSRSVPDGDVSGSAGSVRLVDSSVSGSGGLGSRPVPTRWSPKQPTPYRPPPVCLVRRALPKAPLTSAALGGRDDANALSSWQLK